MRRAPDGHRATTSITPAAGALSGWIHGRFAVSNTAGRPRTVVHEGTERQDRLTLGPRRLERLTNELRTEPLPLKPAARSPCG